MVLNKTKIQIHNVITRNSRNQIKKNPIYCPPSTQKFRHNRGDHVCNGTTINLTFLSLSITLYEYGQ